jgi:hypothetical protein
MTEAANIERQKRRQAEFVNDEQQRLLEIEDMRLVVKFGDKKRYSDQQCQAIYQELVEAGPTKQGATRTPSKRFSRNSMPTTRLRQQGAISAAEPSTVP